MHLIFQIPALSIKISSGQNIFFAFFTAITIYYFVISRKLFSKLRETSFVLNGFYNFCPVTYYLHNPMDIASLFEVYVLKEYEWQILFEPKVILDLGAHFGDSTLYYHAMYPYAKIYAIEPDPYNYSRLVENTEKMGNIIAVQCAIGDKEGLTDFYRGTSSLGYSLQRRGSDDEVIRVQQKTLEGLMRYLGLDTVDLIKFDIEGGEFSFFSIPNSLSRAKALIGEVHFDLVEGWDIATVESHLHDFSLSLQKLKTDSRYIVRAFRK